jgi:predicted O-methyltransferase YrrM
MRDAVRFISGQLSSVNNVNAVEVGGGYGVHAAEFAGSFKFSSLTLVEIFPVGKDSMLSLKKSYPFINVIIDSSVSASKYVDDSSLDFIYIDADHSYEAVKMDIESWFPKLKSGGFMAFHDYDAGVKRAIQEFFPIRGIGVQEFHDQPQSEACARKL